MKKCILSVVCLLAGGTNLLMAEEAWTLERCIAYAIEHNITVKQQQLYKRQQETALSSARNARLPDLSASASESWGFGRALSADNTYVSRNTQSTGFGASTSIPVFTGFRIPNQIVLSRLNLQAAAEELKRAKENISIQITSAYLQVLLSRDMWQVSRDQTRISTMQQERLERFLEAGKAAEADVAEARSRTAQDRLSEVQAENAYRLSVLDLTQLMELSSPDGFEVVTPEQVQPQPPQETPEDIYRIAVQEKPEIKAAELYLKGAERSVRIARSGYYPSLSLGAGLNTSYYKTSGFASHSFGRQLQDNFSKSIGLNLSIPLFNRFQTRNAVRDARLQVENRTLQLEQSKKSLYKEIQQAYYNTVASEQKYRSSLVAETAAKEAFVLAQKKYEQGKGFSTEYEEAKNRYVKAISGRLQSLYENILRTKILAFYKGASLQ